MQEFVRAVGLAAALAGVARCQGVADLAAALRGDGWEEAAARALRDEAASAPRLAEVLARAEADDDGELAGRVLITLTRMGLGAASATDTIWDTLDGFPATDTDTAVRHLDALAAVSPPGVPTPVDRFREVMTRMRRSIESDASAVLLAALKTDLPVVARRGQIDPELGTDELINRLGLADVFDRDVICQLLGRRGRAAEAAVPVLGTALRRLVEAGIERGEGLHVRSDARHALALAVAIPRIRRDGEDAAFAFGYLAQHDVLRPLRRQAVRELMMCGDDAAIAVPFLVEALGDRTERRDREVLELALSCLAILGDRARAARAAVAALADGDDAELAERARKTLDRLGGG